MLVTIRIFNFVKALDEGSIITIINIITFHCKIQVNAGHLWDL